MSEGEAEEIPPELHELFRQEADGIVERLDVLVQAGATQGFAEALRLAHTLKGLAVTAEDHALRDLARSLEASLARTAVEDEDPPLDVLLQGIDAARGLIAGDAAARAAARAAAASLQPPAVAPGRRRPPLGWARRAAWQRVLRQAQGELFDPLRRCLGELEGGRDDWRERHRQARRLELFACAAGVLGGRSTAALGLELSAVLAGWAASNEARRIAGQGFAELERLSAGEVLDAPLSERVLHRVELLRATRPPGEPERIAVSVEFPWPDIDQPGDLLRALERVTEGRAVRDARPGRSDRGLLVGKLGLTLRRQAARDEATILVPRRRLDRLLALVEELVGAKAEARGIRRLARRLAEEPAPQARLGLLRLNQEARELEGRLDHLARATQEAVLSTRLASVRRVFAMARMTVREHLSRHPEKAVTVEVQGGGTEVDKGVLDALVEPVLHLVRNALQHGIESREARLAVGKPEGATLRLAARATPVGVALEVEDDGRGLDAGRLRSGSGSGAEWVEGQIDQGSQAAFAAGASSEATVTDDAGLGVGLSSVLARVRSLRGRLVYRSTPGVGTLARLVVPPAVATGRILLVRAGAERYAIPLASVVTVQEARLARSSSVPRVRLAELVGAPEPAPDPDGLERGRDRFAVLISAPFSRDEAQPEPALACWVDDVLRRELVVLRPIGRRFARPGVDGAALFGDGRLALVLDVWRLYHEDEGSQETHDPLGTGSWRRLEG